MIQALAVGVKKLFFLAVDAPEKEARAFAA
jgi:hypothetical protein